MLITSRGLCVCIRADGNCIKVDEPPRWLHPSIVDERLISINAAYLTDVGFNQFPTLAIKNLLGKIHHVIASSWRLSSRRPYGQSSFFDTDYFKDRIRNLLSANFLEKSASEIKDMPKKVIKSLGPRCTVNEALGLDLVSFARKTGLDILYSIQTRRKLLGIVLGSPKDVETNRQ